MTVKEYNVDLIVFQEVRWPNTKHIESDNLQSIVEVIMEDEYEICIIVKMFNEINKEVLNV